MTQVTRFAPSPTGLLHLGHAFSALFAARAGGGGFRLRLEDIDPQRCKPAFTQAIYDDLAWLGLSWPQPVRVQSAHYADYQSALDRLSAEGLLYPCFCTRADSARAGGAPQQGDYGARYTGRCRGLSLSNVQSRLAAGEAYALRLNADKAWARVTQPLLWHDVRHGAQRVTRDQVDDVVLARTLRGVAGRGVAGAVGVVLPASYHLCVTHDDALEGITLVTRGDDLLASTAIHRLLQHLFNWPVPLYHHHPLLCDAAGKRLAKRDNAKSLQEMRQDGVTASAILAQLEPDVIKALSP